MGEQAVALVHDGLHGRTLTELHFTGTTVLDRASLAALGDGEPAGSCP
jgi:hypothetical protein